MKVFKIIILINNIVFFKKINIKTRKTISKGITMNISKINLVKVIIMKEILDFFKYSSKIKINILSVKINTSKRNKVVNRKKMNKINKIYIIIDAVVISKIDKINIKIVIMIIKNKHIIIIISKKKGITIESMINVNNKKNKLKI